MSEPPFKIRETAVVCQQSWAGLTRTPVEIIKVMPKRVRVRWLTDSVGRHAGAISDVPKWALAKHLEEHASRSPSISKEGE